MGFNLNISGPAAKTSVMINAENTNNPYIFSFFGLPMDIIKTVDCFELIMLSPALQEFKVQIPKHISDLIHQDYRIILEFLSDLCFGVDASELRFAVLKNEQNTMHVLVTLDNVQKDIKKEWDQSFFDDVIGAWGPEFDEIIDDLEREQANENQS